MASLPLSPAEHEERWRALKDWLNEMISENEGAAIVRTGALRTSLLGRTSALRAMRHQMRELENTP